MVKAEPLSKLLRTIAGGGAIAISYPDSITRQLSQSVVASKRLGIDSRQIAGEAASVVARIERERDRLAALNWTECVRLVGIFCFTLGVRIYLGDLVVEGILEVVLVLLGFIGLLLTISLILNEPHEARGATRIALTEILISFFVLGQGRDVPPSIVRRLKAVRRREMMTGFDGNSERRMIFLDELLVRLSSLTDGHRDRKRALPLYEIAFASFEFVVLDFLPLLRLLEQGVNF
jgi:hypothetical protein